CVGATVLAGLGVRGVRVTIRPGGLQRATRRKVERGESNQVLGGLAGREDGQGGQPVLRGGPGRHSKRVQGERGRIVHFDTFMTGEVYAALCAHTILGRTMQPSEAFDEQAFDRGLSFALSDAGSAGSLSTIFSTRTLGLPRQFAASSQPA
ncbi:2-dehydro-3-deoxygalactonokinase, partial [Pseudomonas syringae]